MARLRYVKTAEEVKASREGGAEFLAALTDVDEVNIEACRLALSVEAPPTAMRRLITSLANPWTVCTPEAVMISLPMLAMSVAVATPPRQPLRSSRIVLAPALPAA